MGSLGDYIGSMMEVASQRLADESQKRNAGYASYAGLEVRVTRVYDGVGINHGKAECSWCLERCGEDMTLEEAYRKGAFQRHEECGCIIEYTSKKGERTVQTGSYSGWNFDDELEKRKSIGLGAEFFADEQESRFSAYAEVAAFELLEQAKRGGHRARSMEGIIWETWLIFG